jgi:outer membrane protein assembly factor BamD
MKTRPGSGGGSGPRRGRGWTGWSLLLLAGASLLFQGCALYDALYGRPARREGQRSDQELLRSAEVQLQRRRYEQARQDLQRLINQYPESELVAAARLSSAKALYLEKKFDEARAEYQRFLDLHPQDERADEAHYYLGMAYFRQADNADRDQSFTRKALDEFELILRQMPDSPFAAEARDRSGLARRKLAEKEVYVGTFYFRRGKYAAAAGRFSNVLAQYGGAGLDDQALYYLAESLWQLEQKEEARAAFHRLVQEHSQSDWAALAAARLGITLVRTGPPKAQGPGAMDRLWQGLKETWDELAETVKDAQIFR